MRARVADPSGSLESLLQGPLHLLIGEPAGAVAVGPQGNGDVLAIPITESGHVAPSASRRRSCGAA